MSCARRWARPETNVSRGNSPPAPGGSIREGAGSLMCGIAGTAGFANREQLIAMNEAIVHRGPDDGGVQVLARGGEPWIGLANRRLAIIDLSAAGHQPMSNEDGSVWIAYNGETFNF